MYEYAPGAWTIARYDDVREISRDPERFCSGRGVLMNDPLRRGGEIHGSILHMDPPAHAPWRQLVNRRFTPRAVTAFAGTIRATANSVLDELTTGETVDFVDRVAAPFPVLVIAELLGIADADRDDFRRWSDAAISSPDSDSPALDDLAALYRFLIDHVRARRDAPPDDDDPARSDIATRLATAEIDGRRLTTAEAVGYCLALLVAGNETTRHLTSGSVLALSEHPAQRDALAADPAGMEPARSRNVCAGSRRSRPSAVRSPRDTEIGGARVHEGDWLVMLYASANRDERAFGETADRFDVTPRSRGVAPRVRLR